MASMCSHPAYKHWRGIQQRCFSSAFLKRRPSYVGTSVVEDWNDFWEFSRWCETQVGYNIEGWQLDKDLLSDSKLYSPDTCVFVPNELNCLINGGRSGKNATFASPLKNGKYRTRVTSCGIKYFDGVFDTELEAIEAYKSEKLSVIKKRAEYWKESISPRLYTRLIEMTEEDL